MDELIKLHVTLIVITQGIDTNVLEAAVSRRTMGAQPSLAHLQLSLSISARRPSILGW
jgi:hypothetical protein